MFTRTSLTMFTHTRSIDAEVLSHLSCAA